MGFARVVSGGPDGRYVIEVDYGESTRVAVVASLSALLVRLQNDLSTAQFELAEAEAKEAAKLLQVQQAQAAYIAEAQALPPGSPLPDSGPWQFLQAELLKLQAANAPLRLRIAGLEFDIANRSKELTRWTTLSLIEQRPAWCVTLTENLSPGQYPATVEIPGESNLILIAPNGRAWTAADGQMRAREIMSPSQAYFNAAILPGWQKDKPTYRWGTITAISYEGNTADVALADAESSAQSLNVNQSSSLSSVPVVYMTCNAEAFEVGDRVVVEFIGQDWSAPRVIGFVDNPKECEPWPAVYITRRMVTELSEAASGGTASWLRAFDDVTPHFCGTGGGVPGTFPTGRKYRQLMRFGDVQFAPDAEVDGHVINVTLPADTIYGISEEVDFVTAEAIVPTTSPHSYWYQSGSNVYVQKRPFAIKNTVEWFVEEDGVTCFSVPISGNIWTAVQMPNRTGPGYVYGLGAEYWETELVGPAPAFPEVSVTKEGVTRVYEIKGTVGLPTAYATTRRYGPA